MVCIIQPPASLRKILVARNRTSIGFTVPYSNGSDVLQPLGPILFYTLILALAGAILLTITRNKFGEKVRVAIGFLWIWSSISGIFITSQLLLGASGTGVTADLVPGVASLQNRLGIMQEQIEAVRVNTEEIKETTEEIEEALKRMTKTHLHLFYSLNEGIFESS